MVAAILCGYDVAMMLRVEMYCAIQSDWIETCTFDHGVKVEHFG